MVNNNINKNESINDIFNKNEKNTENEIISNDLLGTNNKTEIKNNKINEKNKNETDDDIFGDTNNNEVKNLFLSGNDKENSAEANNNNNIFNNNSRKQSENKTKPAKINTNINEKKINPKIVAKKEKYVINNNLNEFLSKEEENIDDIFGPRNNNGEGLFG